VLLIMNWYDQTVHRGVADYARRHGWALQVIGAHDFHVPQTWEGDGIICLLEDSPELYRLVKRAKVPVVDMADRHPGLPLTRVLVDGCRMGKLAATHLLERGFRHFACFRFRDLWQETGREAGFVEAAQQAGMTATVLQWSFPAPGRPGSFKAEIAALQALPKPLGLFIMHDHETDKLIRPLLDAGINVPGDIAIVSVNNDELLCDFAPVPITSVDPDWFTLGWKAAETLDGLMGGNPRPAAPLLVPPKGIVTRASTDIFTVADADTARALRYIHNNSHLNLGVDDVVAYIGISRSSLQRRFREFVNSSINGQIARIRIRRIQELLRHPDISGATIARMLNFDSPRCLYAYFRKHTGTCLSDYRQQGL
jgi:LacI family transcriptional regulator